MADTKISALADITALAAGDKLAVADASDLTASKSATMTEVNTYLRTLPISSAEITALPAASAAAGTNTFPVDQGGTAGEMTVTQLNTYLQSLALASAQITALGAASALAAANSFAVDQSGTAKEATMTQLRTWTRPTVAAANSTAVDYEIGATTLQVLTANEPDITTTTVVTQLTLTGVDAGWYLVEYRIIWQSNVSTTGITFIVDHTGTAVNSQSTREDMIGSTTALATVGVAAQASNLSVAGALPSNWAVRTDAGTLGPNSGVDLINVNQLTRITSLILVTGTGSLTLRANSEIASTTTRVCAGTMARYTRLT